MASLGDAARRRWTGARVVYQHVAAVLAVPPLLHLVSTLGVDWRGYLATWVAAWTDTIKPVADRFFDLVVTTPAHWVGVTVVVPVVVRDYLTVGFILGTSFARVGASRRVHRRLFEGPERRHSIVYLVRNASVIALTWPIMILRWSPSLVRQEVDAHAWRLASPEQVAFLERHHLIRSPLEYCLFVAPLLVLGLLLAINYLVL